MRKNSQNWPKGAKKGQSQAGRGGRDIISYRLFRKLEIAFVPVFSRDVFFIKLIWQNENFIIFHNFFSSNFQEHVEHTCHISIERVLDHATYLAHLQFSRGHQPA